MTLRISVLLPTPLRPEHAHDLALADADADALEHVAGGIAGAQVGDLEDRVHGSGPPEIDAAHVRVRGDLVDRALGEDAALVQHRDAAAPPRARRRCRARRRRWSGPDRLRCWSTRAVCSVSSGDMPAVGSSSSRMSGPPASTMAISSHCSWWCGSSRAGVFAVRIEAEQLERIADSARRRLPAGRRRSARSGDLEVLPTVRCVIGAVGLEGEADAQADAPKGRQAA